MISIDKEGILRSPRRKKLFDLQNVNFLLKAVTLRIPTTSFEIFSSRSNDCYSKWLRNLTHSFRMLVVLRPSTCGCTRLQNKMP